MGLFRRTAPAPAPRRVQAATVTASTLNLAASGLSAGRDRAMRIPTISRARDLLAGLVSTTPLEHLEVTYGADGRTETIIPPDPWMIRPDPTTTRAHIMSWTADDIMFTGRAIWQTTGRYADGRPRSFRWIPSDLVQIVSPLVLGNYPVGGMSALLVNGTEVDPADYVIFYSGQSPLLSIGSRAVLTAERLDNSAQRFATNPVAAGYLKQTGGDPLSGDELSDLAGTWVELREDLAVAALGLDVEFRESTIDPSRLQSVESRQHQALELARIANISPFLVGAPTGSGMTYNNAQQARAQLAQDALPILAVIEETLTDVALPRGREVRFDREALTRTVGGDPTEEEMTE